jgi:putative oxidoreductase
LLGVQARLGALLLIGFIGFATILAHPFWSRRGAEFRQSFTLSLEHLAMIGGFVMIAALGSGSLSLDRTLMQ